MTLATMQEHEQVTLDHGATDYRRSNLVTLVQDYVRGPRVLDMRCLTGHLTVALALKGYNVTGLDGYPPAVDMTNELAKNRGLSETVAQHWNLAGLVERFGPNEFDTVLCVDLLHHVEDDRKLLAEVAQVLKPGGRLFLSAPAFPFLLGERDKSMGHLRRYQKSTLCAMLQSHGFEIQSVRYWNFTGLLPYFVLEKVMRKGLPDKIRYAQSRTAGSLPNRVLSWWYGHVENKVTFPVGLTFFIIAHKRVIEK